MLGGAILTVIAYGVGVLAADFGQPGVRRDQTERDREWFAAQEPFDFQILFWKTPVFERRSFGYRITTLQAMNASHTLTAVRYRAGWPFAAASGEAWKIDRNSDGFRGRLQWVDTKEMQVAGLGRRRIFPLRASPPGIAANILFFTLVAAALWWLARSIVRAWRARRGRCRACGYPVTGLARCPECGLATPRGDPPAKIA